MDGQLCPVRKVRTTKEALNNSRKLLAFKPISSLARPERQSLEEPGLSGLADSDGIAAIGIW